MELLTLQSAVYIHTCDDAGTISVAEVTAVTRHDPGHTLYDVTTKGGRNVIVTAGKSLIVFDQESYLYKEKPMPEIAVGDSLPTLDPNGVVVPDMIVSITLIDVRPGTPGYAKYPKMYDLTVPSTLNFALANGLVVRDTAETGYLQRQMVKAMEDLVTQHDGTVRDARGGIVQFHYGEDGLSSTKVETQGLPLNNMSTEDIRKTMGLQGVTNWDEILSVPRTENTEAINAFAEAVIADRDMLVNGVFRNGRSKSLQGPMNLDRMIMNLKVKFNIQAGAKTDLTPEYVLDRIRDLHARTLPFHRMWGAMIRFHLGPHSSVVKHRLTQTAFNALMEQILLKNWAAWAQAGEQVGIIAAQSIGETATQM